MLRTTFLLASLLTFAVGGCKEEADDAADSAAGVGADPAATDPGAPAPDTDPAPGRSGIRTIDLDLKADALPTSALEASDFLADPCKLASAEEMKAFLGFVASDITQKTEEKVDRAACIYLGQDPETEIQIHFDSAKQQRGVEEIELGGLSGVKLRLMDDDATLSIPFEAAKDSSKRPADRLLVKFDMYRQSMLPTWNEEYRRPTEEDLRALMESLGTNLIRRLQLADG